jgi:tetratricopeptide (TPR) repeat protein
LSLLSKPAAIIFPLVLLLLDYWYEGGIAKKRWLEKIPFFIFAVIFSVITVKTQAGTTAIAGLDTVPVWARFFYGCYTVMIYFIRFFIPYPLSAFHPYPFLDHISWEIYFSPVFILAMLVFLWYQRRNKMVLFGFLFFVINLLLVSQVISIGYTLVAERYTYMPYIGLAFLCGMWLNKFAENKMKPLLWVLPLAITIVFGYITYQRTQVWKDSDTLWTDVINRYPDAPVPRTNRANYYTKLMEDPANKSRANELFQKALDDCNNALRVDPKNTKGYENRQKLYLEAKRYEEAFADANTLIKLVPDNQISYNTRGIAYGIFNKPDSSLADFNKCLSINPNIDFTLNNRGSILVNVYQRYNDALIDFTKAIQLNPQGSYYLNRSICYYKLGDLEKSRADAQIAMQKGQVISESYKALLKL